MRRFVVFLLLALMLTGVNIPTVLGSDYREIALSYLMEKYSVPEERVDLAESETLNFTRTGESFWFAKYDVAPENTKEGNYIYGGVHIRIKTGEIFDREEMEPFFAAENDLAHQEWERLRVEAGKLDVSLYQTLQGLSATDTLTVWISPAISLADINADLDKMGVVYEANDTSVTAILSVTQIREIAKWDSIALVEEVLFPIQDDEVIDIDTIAENPASSMDPGKTYYLIGFAIALLTMALILYRGRARTCKI